MSDERLQSYITSFFVHITMAPHPVLPTRYESGSSLARG
jgi:hypothetical protein